MTLSNVSDYQHHNSQCYDYIVVDDDRYTRRNMTKKLILYPVYLERMIVTQLDQRRR
jgi:hypothetical protein